ncbi:MAG: YbaY family lipoprotein, partial [Candidatus Angelobacter sp.]
MRKVVLATLSVAVAALLLAGCGTSSQSGNSSAGAGTSQSAGAAGTPATTATAVTGTVTLESQNIPVTPQAKLELSLVDVTQQPGVTVNKQEFNSPKFPQEFRIPFSPSAINANDLYVLQATMQDNGRTWSTKLQQPVLTHGQGASVNITLAAEPTPSEKMLADFQDAKRQTGGMKVKSGTSSKIGESRSWQVFSDVHGVEFIIVQVNQADKGFTKTEYAYRDGLPWVV